MAEYIDKEQFLASMGLTGDETKYGNRDAEHQHRSYSTYMSYEIMDCVDDSIVEEELVPVVNGRWEPHYEHDFVSDEDVICGLHCSLCGLYYVKRHNYCPNCGARMDGE